MVSNEQSEAVTKLYQYQVLSAAGAGVPREREKVRFVSTDTEAPPGTIRDLTARA